MRLAVVTLLLALLTAGCESVPVPEVTWYRLPDPALPPARTARFEMPVDVAIFSADGIYADQALIYALDRVLQRRLIRVLRQIDAAPQVSDRLPASANVLRVSAVIQRFERVEDAAGWHVDVALQMRVEHAGALLAEETYAARVLAENAEIPATIVAYGTALDQIYAGFIARLAALSVPVPT